MKVIKGNGEISSNNIYSVGTAIHSDPDGSHKEVYVMLKNSIPMYEVSCWLETISLGSIKTGRKYAYELVSYLRYLDAIGMQYRDVHEKKIIDGYRNHLLLGTENSKVKSIGSTKTFKAATVSLSVVSTFYAWLEGRNYNSPIPTNLEGKATKRYNKMKNSFLYGQIWQTDYSKELKENYRFRQNKEHTKWYTEEEKEALASNFKTIRDKVIFLITVEGGARIDEILTLKYEDYNSIERTIFIRKSKTFCREIVLPRYVCDEIDRYISTERQEVEIAQGLLDDLFINLKCGDTQGSRVEYRNYWEVLKRCAKRAGMDPSKVITHAGRSTRAQELIEMQILSPEQGITDTLICDVMGWTSIDSAKPYRKQLSYKTQKVIVDKIEERKRG